MPKFFNIELTSIAVESLSGGEYEYYFKLAVQDSKTKSKLLGAIVEALVIKLKPSKARVKIQQIIGKFIQGRNVLAVYTKK